MFVRAIGTCSNTNESPCCLMQPSTQQSMRNTMNVWMIPGVNLTQTQHRLLIALMIHPKLIWFLKKKEGEINWIIYCTKRKEMELHFVLLPNLLENKKRHFIKLLFNRHIHLNHTWGLMAAYYYLYLIRSFNIHRLTGKQMLTALRAI